MSSLPHDNVILFPKTVEYYQYELTRLLEAERYGEAIELLVFLLGCHSADSAVREEWQSLLDWMRMMFPDLTGGQPSGEEEPEQSESELLRSHLLAREEKSEAYAERLLETIRSQQAPDKLLLALDQLAFLEHGRIDEALTGWLREEELHPLIQFKTLQTLKKRGVTGSVTLHKNGESAVCEIEDTPADFDRFPSQIQEIIARVQEISEIKHPALSYFASQTWNEFLAYIYGTSAYRQMLRQDEACVDVWAAALHLTLLERVFDGGDKEELLELYGITSDLTFQWEQAYRIMQQFASAMFGRGL
ncbi:hypothetical protein SAMN02799630_02883 [Paenibacillus sp. UNCCL117]|uniref:hypothetical protein n=1 Tax=unclassified Paenibacillus TaxID=185978 RepID=UPI000887E8E7|nr:MULTISPECIES: hypothetical protein [unclassified Paenibacillus]SDD25824.1 hypothetical protein SAMN04488602_10782 [Paenibacillus sp. cl123]SFW41201.1 hypothetical protein SAMN02799630_02883 [Paenibacillus sp. UNCCL117]